MLNVIINPDPVLKPYIQYYIALEIDIPDKDIGIICTFPTGCCVSNILYSDDLPVFLFPNGEEKVYRAFISGYLQKGVRIGNSGKFKGVLTLFTCLGAYHLLGVMPSEFINTFVSLYDFPGVKFNNLIEIVYEAENSKERINALNQFYTRRLEKVNFSMSAFEIYLDSIVRRKGMLHVGNMIQELNISQRGINRSFNRFIGITPKEYARLIRLNLAYNMLLRNLHQSIADITYSLGYFDQAHMIKDFAYYSELLPGDFRRQTNKTLFQPAYFKDDYSINN